MPGRQKHWPAASYGPWPWTARPARGARRADGTRAHLLGVAEHGGRLLDHLEVDVKHNETSHFTELLQPLDLASAVVTFDALHTVRANLHWLTAEKKAHYIAVIKRNQPLLYDRVRALPWRQVPAGGTTPTPGTGASRPAPSRPLTSAAWISPAPARPSRSPAGGRTPPPGKISREAVYAITSLTSACATAADLARLVPRALDYRGTPSHPRRDI